MHCLGIDIGSTSIKGGVLEPDSGRITDIQREPFPEPVHGLPAAWHEVDPLAVVSATQAVIERLLQAAPRARQLFVSSQMGGVVLMDSSGRPLTNYLSWRDQRTVIEPPSAGSLQQLRQRWTGEQFTELGRELKPGSATSLLHWLAEHNQLPADAAPVSIGDFVLSRLCLTTPVMHRSQAIGLLDLTSNEWHYTALEAAGLGTLVWPPLVDGCAIAGVARIGGRELECVAAIGDQQAALFGMDLQPGELSINVSTGSQVSCRTAQFQPADCQTRPWIDGGFLNTVTHIPAGRSLNVLESLLTELSRRAGQPVTDSWSLIAQAAAESARSGLQCDLSFFDSATGSTGSITNITTENLSAGSLFLAAFEFMADSYAACSQRLTPSTAARRGAAWKQVVVSGGLVQKFAPLRRMLSERFPFPFRMIAEYEETLSGLLKLAGAG
jgi:sugar (pentulose or hexulose) kinase